MPVTQGYRDFVIEQIERIIAVTSKNMFGGVGIRTIDEDLFFALISNDRLYFKVDETNQSEYDDAGSQPFSPYGDGRSMKYYEVPIGVIEDPDRLKIWADKAVEVARRKATGKRSSRSR